MARSSKERGRQPGLEFAEQVYRVVRKVPRGRVLTYGQVAKLAGYPGAARAVGSSMRALKAAQAATSVPWQRVVGRQSRSRGKISIHDPVGAALQCHLLREEGVDISAANTISLERFGWLPIAD